MYLTGGIMAESIREWNGNYASCLPFLWQLPLRQLHTHTTMRVVVPVMHVVTATTSPMTATVTRNEWTSWMMHIYVIVICMLQILEFEGWINKAHEHISYSHHTCYINSAVTATFSSFTISTSSRHCRKTQSHKCTENVLLAIWFIVKMNLAIPSFPMLLRIEIIIYTNIKQRPWCFIISLKKKTLSTQNSGRDVGKLVVVPMFSMYAYRYR